MSYYCNTEYGFSYNGKKYSKGQKIEDFGIGRFDDILLNSKQVISDGSGTGVEDRIANLARWRKENMKDSDPERMREEELNWQSDFDKYKGENERVEV